jgi:uncharacterized repeat protein (TIGR01451 family)
MVCRTVEFNLHNEDNAREDIMSTEAITTRRNVTPREIITVAPRTKFGENAEKGYQNPRNDRFMSRRHNPNGRRLVLNIILALLFIAGLWSTPAQATTTITDQFSPATINPGDAPQYTITVANSSTVALTAAAVTVLLPTGVTIANPATISNTCGFTVNAAASGTNKIYLTAGTIPAGNGTLDGTCIFRLNVTSTTPGNATATIPANTTPSSTVAGYSALENTTPVWNGTPASATLSVNTLSPPTGTKTFTPSTVSTGDPSVLSIVLTNPNAGATMPLTTFTDTLPSGMVVANPATASVTCSGTGVSGTLTANTGASSITLAGGVIAANNGTCTIYANVVVTSIGTSMSKSYTNNISAGAIGNTRGLSNILYSKALTVQTPPLVAKSFSPTTVSISDPSLMTITITNRSTTNPLTVTSFNDNLTGTGLIILDTTSTPTPAPANPTVTCTGTGAVNGTLTAPVNALNQTINLANAVAGPSGVCTITAYATSATAATHTNSILANAVTNPNNYASASASAALTTLASLTVTKTVSVANVAPGQYTQFTVNINNWAGGQVTGLNFKDVLPANGSNQMTLVNPGGGFYTLTGCGSPSVFGTNAAGTSTGVAPASGDAGIMFTGGTILDGAPGVCTVKFYAQVPATATTGMTFVNTVPVGNITGTGPSGGVQNSVAGTVTVTTNDLVAVSKAFSPTSVSEDNKSTLTITIRNRSTTALSGVNLLDNLPANVLLDAVPLPSNGCSGTLTADPRNSFIRLVGGSVGARTAGSTETTCAITARVIGLTPGAYVNTINSVDVSYTGQTVAVPAATATLTITDGIAGAKSFSPTSVASGGTSRVTITVTNKSTYQLTNVSVDDNTFSTGLNVANPANAATNCSGSPTMIVNPGDTRAQLQGAVLPAAGSCVFSFDVVTSGTGPWSNTIPAGKITSAQGETTTSSVTANLTKTATPQININKSFNPVLVSGGQPSLLQIDVINPTTSVVSGVGFTDTFPSGMQVYAVPGASTTCTGGTVMAIHGDGKVILSGATLAAQQTCQVYLKVTSIKFLNLTNTIPAGSVVSSQGFTNPTAASATISTLQALEVMKAFSPSYVAPNQTTTLKLTLVSTYDPNAPVPVNLTGLTFTDSLPAGVHLAATPNASTTCGGSISATSGGSTVTLSGATVNAGTTCTVFVDVVATSLGAYTNTISANTVTTTQGVTNSLDSSATLFVVTTPTVSKTFALATATIGSSNLLTVTINNGATVPITGVSLTDTLPAGLQIAATPSSATTCVGGTVTATSGGATLSLSGATLLAGSSCTFSANTASNTPGTYNNSIAAGSIVTNEGVTNSAAATASFTVSSPPTLSKSFTPATITAGGTSVLTITIGNSNTSSISLAASFTDDLPGSVVVATTPGVTTTNCSGTITATAGAGTVTLANGFFISANAVCTITVNVTSAVAGTFNNIIEAGQLSTTAGVNQQNTSASLAVGASLLPPTFSKNFNPATTSVGSPSALTITLGNPNSGALTLSSIFTDTLPTNVVVAATPNIRGTCATGSVTAGAGTGTITYASGAIIPSGGCTIIVDVIATAAGSYSNSLAATTLVTNAGSPTLPITASLFVQAATPPTVLKSFSPGTINPGGASTLTIILGNSNSGAITLTNLFTDTLPTNVIVASTPNIRGTCTTGSVTAGAGTGAITYANGASIPSGGCTIIVDVTSSTANSTFTNSISAGTLQTSAGNNVGAATANLFVNPAQPPSISKSFTPAVISSGGTATLTLSLGNGNLAGTTLNQNSDLVDTLPTNVVIDSSPNVRVSTGCTLAKVVATAGGSTLTYQSGGVIPAGGCSISVDVHAVATGIYTNTIAAGALQTGYGNNAVGTSASLKVKVLPSVSKGFAPATMLPGATSTLTITLGNTNPFIVTLTSDMVDTLPTNLVLATPATVGGTCDPINVTATAAGSTVTYKSGGSIPANVGCTITVPVTSTHTGIYTNTIPIDDVKTDVGNNAAAATADLLAPVAPTLVKSFSPGTINAGIASSLTLSLGNGNATGTTLTNVLTDNLPPNVVVAGIPNIRGTCATGSVTASAGSGTISYASGATIPSGGCTIIVDVTSSTGGIYTNTIVAGALQTGYGNNAAPTSANLTVRAPPTVAKAFSPATIFVGGSSTLTLILGNTNAAGLTLSADLVDTLPTGLVLATPATVGGTCTTSYVTATAGGTTVTYRSGASLPAGGCTITVPVTTAIGGSYLNTITAGALQTEAGSNAAPATATLTVTPLADLSIRKTASTMAPANGDNVIFTLSVTNHGPSDATLVKVTDILPSGLVWQSDTSGGSYNHTTGLWSIGTLAVNASTSITITAQVNLVETDNILNIASVVSSVADPDRSNNSSGLLLNSGGSTQADLGVYKNVDNFTPQVGQNVTFTITVTNNGPDNTTGVQVTDRLPTGLTWVSDDSATAYDHTTGVWTVGNLDVNAKATLRITAQVGSTGQIINTAQITASNQPDPDITNNHSSVTLHQTNPLIADLAVQKIVNDPAVASLANALFTIVVRNNGPNDATNIQIKDIMTSGLEYKSSVPSQGSYDPVTGIWVVGTIPSGTYTFMEVTAQVITNLNNAQTNMASVYSVTEFDPDSNNNSSVVTLSLAGITITKKTNGIRYNTPNGPNLVIDRPVNWTYEVTNTGTVILKDVKVIDTNNKVSGDVTVCTIGTLDPGQAATPCSMSGTVLHGLYANTGTVSGKKDNEDIVTASDTNYYTGVVVCDVNGDGKIDRTDINLIFAARDQLVGPGDPRDLDHDGIISINDARGCVLRCTKAKCEP